MAVDILEKIVAKIRDEESARWAEWERNPVPPRRSRPSFPVSEALAKGFLLICEVKKASPSKGVLRDPFDPLAIARDYEAGGAGALSILTEKAHFQGHPDFLRDIGRTAKVPILRKDFIVHPCQLRDAAEWGADLVLLIADLLDREELISLSRAARAFGLSTLVEVHGEDELDRALSCEPDLLGFNNRNLRTFEVDLETGYRLKRLAGDRFPVVAESGIFGADTLKELQDRGFAGALVGESLVRQADVHAATVELRSRLS